MYKTDEQYMIAALELAQVAATQDEIPIGALVVNTAGDVVGQGYNRVEHFQCQIHHAEVRAIQAACKESLSWRLEGHTLFVTLEPCMMCISFCALSRIERIVYGADSPLFGYRLDKEGVLALYTKQIKNITGHVLAQESAQLLKNFFVKKRERCGEC